MAIEVKGSKQPALASDVTPPPGKTYGQNAPQPSSVKVGESADLSALDIRCKGEDALDLVRAGQHHGILSDDSDTWQRRKISDNQMSLAHGMKKPDGSPSGNAG